MVTASTGQPVSIVWAMAFHFVNDLGFANVLPVGLALNSRSAPKGYGGRLIATYYLHLFLDNMFVGYLGGLLGEMSGADFWFMHAWLMVIPIVVLFGARHLPLPAMRAVPAA